MARQDATTQFREFEVLIDRKFQALIESLAGGIQITATPAPHALNSASHTGLLASTQAPQFVLLDGSRQLTGNWSVAAGITIDGVDISDFKSTFDARQVIAGSGLTGGGALGAGNATINVGAGDGISVAADAVAVDATVVRTSRTITAGNGLTGGGDLSANRTLDIGAGTLISVAADAVSLANGSAQYQVPVTGATPFTPVYTALSTFAGAGLAFSSNAYAVGAGAGITVNADDVALTTPGTLTASSANSSSGNHTHAITASSAPGVAASLLKSDASGLLTLEGMTLNGTLNARHILPSTTDTYDLGSSTKLWRKGWLAELDAVLFAKSTASLIGGWLIITKNEGVLPSDVASGATTIDFGMAMTPNDFVLFRAAGQVEYMQVGTLVSGTTYNVTRNLDGSGANNWAGGAVFAVLGNSTNGRIELNANDTPRIQIIKQGATYNAQTELVRIGDLNGAYGIATELYGIGIGDYSGGNYLRYDPTNDFVIRAGNGAIYLDELGISIEIPASQTDVNAYRFVDGGPSGTLHSALYGFATGTTNTLTILAENIGSLDTTVNIQALAPSNQTGKIVLTAKSGIAQSLLTLEYNDIGTKKLSSGFSVNEFTGSINIGSATAGSTGDLSYSANLRPYRNSTLYTAYAVVPLLTPLTSTSWDGDDSKTVGTHTIDTSSVFGAPAGIKMALVRFNGQWAAAASSSNAGIRSSGGSSNTATIRAQTTFFQDYFGLVPCDANGDIDVVVAGATLTNTRLEIWGYCI